MPAAKKRLTEAERLRADFEVPPPESKSRAKRSEPYPVRKPEQKNAPAPAPKKKAPTAKERAAAPAPAPEMPLAETAERTKQAAKAQAAQVKEAQEAGFGMGEELIISGLTKKGELNGLVVQMEDVRKHPDHAIRPGRVLVRVVASVNNKEQWRVNKLLDLAIKRLTPKPAPAPAPAPPAAKEKRGGGGAVSAATPPAKAKSAPRLPPRELRGLAAAAAAGADAGRELRTRQARNSTAVIKYGKQEREYSTSDLPLFPIGHWVEVPRMDDFGGVFYTCCKIKAHTSERRLVVAVPGEDDQKISLRLLTKPATSKPTSVRAEMSR